MRIMAVAVILCQTLFFTATARADAALDAALVTAASMDNVKSMQSLLDKGASIEGRLPTNNYTPLMAAAASRSQESVKFLLSKKANVNATTNDGTSVLMVAAIGGDAAIVESLIKHGAKVDHHDDRVGATPLIMAVSEGQAGAVQALLKAHANVNAKASNGATALKVAQDNKNEEIVKLLKAHGAK